MGQDSKIQWTDATWPIVQGCWPVSPGCANCYVPRTLVRHVYNPNPKISLPVQGLIEQKPRLRFTGKVALREDRMNWPLTWHKPSMIFVPSHGDLFHEDVPDDFILRVFDVMRTCTWAGGQNCGRIRGSGHTFQVLTKRAERMADFGSRLRWDGERLFLGDTGGQHMLPINRQIWMGVSCEDQQRAKERIPHLLQCPAAVRFLSCEPLLAEINLSEWLQWPDCTCDGEFSPCEVCDARGPREDLSWVIAGGESGPGARPCTIGHIRSLVRQCQAAGVACFVKQLGAKPVNREGVPHPLKDAKGGDPAEWPEDLRVREMPATEGAIQ